MLKLVLFRNIVILKPFKLKDKPSFTLQDHIFQSANVCLFKINTQTFWYFFLIFFADFFQINENETIINRKKMAAEWIDVLKIAPPG